MRKIVTLAMAVMLCISLCACTKTETAYEPTPKAPEQSQQETVSTEAGNSVHPLPLGEKVDTGFVSLEFSSAALTYSVGGHGFSTTAGDGKRCFSLVGIAENTGNAPLPIETMCAEMVFNDQYTYTAYGKMIDSDRIPASLAPLEQNGFWVYAEIPENLVDQLESCVVRFSFNKDCATYPKTVDDGDFVYEVELSENDCAAALDATGTASIFFDECPILPTPESFEPVSIASSGSSSLNGRASSIYYSYMGILGRNDNMEEVFQDYVQHIQKLGFAVKENGADYDVYAGTVKVATASVNSQGMKFDIVPGNESIDSSVLGEADNSESQPESVLKIGDTVETDYCRMTLDKYDSGMEITSGTGQSGSYRYYTSENGDPYFYIFGSFKNLSGKPVDIRNIYVQMCFDGTYNYRGEISGVSDAIGNFITDVSPLAEVNYYIYAAVPQELIDSYKTCEIKVGFTENFDYKVIDVNDLPQFKMCDDIFTIVLP